MKNKHQAKYYGRGKEITLQDLFCQTRAVADFLQQVFSAHDAGQDPDRQESKQRTPPDKISQDAACAVTELGYQEKGKHHDDDVQQEQDVGGNLVFHSINRTRMTRIDRIIRILFVGVYKCFSDKFRLSTKIQE